MKRQRIADLIRLRKIIRSRKSFWTYCQTLSPDFYRDDREHLKTLCDTLQAFWFYELLKDDGTPYMNLMINMPPRFGKTRTMIMFCAWIMGLMLSTKVIAISYNSRMAEDFSSFTRNIIAQERNLPHQIVHSDIFPECKLKFGDKSKRKWALEGQFFNYLGSGIDGTVTGWGGDLILTDDLVKNAYEAYNITSLDRIWDFLVGTLLSRGEQKDELAGNRRIDMGTRWSLKDPFGRSLDGPEAGEYYILKMEAMKNGDMLCPSILNLKNYLKIKRQSPIEIFRANYHQEPMDIVGRLYTKLLTYDELPKSIHGKPLMESISAYADVADTGADYFCMYVFLKYKHIAYILDILYTKDGMELTEPATAAMLFKNKVNKVRLESQAGGRGFARSVRKLLKEKHKSTLTTLSTFHQSKNKEARILSMSTNVMENVLFPIGWKNLWPEAYEALTSYQKEGGNDHDDAPDALTGVAEMIDRANVATAGPDLRM
jgi:predicted phage terminase large subunit-like protein